MALTRREAFARVMEHLCSHDGAGGHGYSQAARQGSGSPERVDLGDGVTVTLATGDRDCSSAVVTSLQAVGVDTRGATYTGNMRSQLLLTGLFSWQPMSFTAQRGDIYLNEACHTAVCTSADPDMLAQFSISETGGVTGAVGDQTGGESNISPYYDYPWDGILHWTSDGGTIGGAAAATSQEADEMQCIIQPNGENRLVWFDGHACHDLNHPDQVTAINKVYQQTHGGASIPSFVLGSKTAPWYMRLLQAVKLGC